ncbi:alpha/beta hydrolase [Crenobacter sp. SG2303]|uniref:Alpha/beta hydrolase n=1 Tax=Crenobacter oryzisoli TaxID=3056844 RepID=A0ABT7XR43_9NEIS|nr:alpha/beta hydrolase [Crenobacter sp. SG2303]MDN0076262.1 alpha/beta hydrolase [Crenobacter sp. SG2303]
MRETIHFAHANSFPAGVYRKMLAALASEHEVGYMDLLGHNPRFPVTDCWPHLVDETIDYIESHYTKPVIGVGHSLGGFLLFFAAVRRPELFRGLVILDSPLMGPLRSRGIWLSKKFGLIDRMTPGGKAARRRDGWGSVAEVRDYFGRKPIFASWDPDCLSDYAEFGTVDDGRGQRLLKFRPAVEHAIFRHLPHNFPRYRGRLKVPAAFVAGTHSNVVKPADLRYMQRHFGMNVLQQRGTHLFPMEHPQETARKILELLPALAR